MNNTFESMWNVKMLRLVWCIREQIEAFENFFLKFCYSVAHLNEFKFENNKNKSRAATNQRHHI